MDREFFKRIDVHSHIEIPEAVDLLPEKPPDAMAPRPDDPAYTYTLNIFIRIRCFSGQITLMILGTWNIYSP